MFVFLSCLFILLNIQCSRQPQSNRIVPINLLKSESLLLQDVGISRHAAFRMELAKDIQWADFWVDYYENGKYKEKQFSGGFSLKNRPRNSKLLLTQITSIPGFSDELWTLSITSQHRNSRNISLSKEEGFTEWKVSPEQTIVLNQAMAIFILVRHPSSIESLEDSVFESDPLAWDKLMKNRHVYVLRMQFKTEK